MIVRKYIILFILLVLNVTVLAQRAFDGEMFTGFNAMTISFKDSVNLPIIDTPLIDDAVFEQGWSSIADSNGKLAFGCGGYVLFNYKGKMIEGSNHFNPQKITDYESGSSILSQNSIILPKQGSQYYVFTTTISDAAFDKWQANIEFRFDMLTYHIVDMAENNGEGKVLSKNNALMTDAWISHNRMTAVKHANGRDWWLVKPHKKEHIFYLFLVTADTIIGPITKSLPLPALEFPNSDLFASVRGHSCFSQDGSYYAYTLASLDGVFVNKFNRCTGDFEEYAWYDIPTYLDSTHFYDFTIGTCFSPNGKLLYVNTANNIWQMDLSDTSNNSVQFIHGPDTSNYIAFSQYRDMNIGPDNRLYVGKLGGVGNTMSVIDSPNNRGLACRFRPRLLKFPYPNALGLPNIPNYHLGALEGSACDTIVSYVPPEPPIIPTWESIKVYPNPFSNELKVFLPMPENTEVQLILYNLLGQRIRTWNNGLDPTQHLNLDIRELIPGIYVLHVTANGQEWKVKVVRD